MAVTELPPLPPCTCAGAEHGRHLTTCQVAVDFQRGFDAGSRSFYKDEGATKPDGETKAFGIGWDHVATTRGGSWRPISWDRPWRLTGQIDIEVDIDPFLYISERLDRYLKFDPTGEWEEKPVAFLMSELADDYMSYGFGSGGPASSDMSHGPNVEMRASYWNRERGVSDPTSDWTAEDTAKLHQRLNLNEAGTEQVEPHPSLFDEAP